jgi:hypothetical protein
MVERINPRANGHRSEHGPGGDPLMDEWVPPGGDEPLESPTEPPALHVQPSTAARSAIAAWGGDRPDRSDRSTSAGGFPAYDAVLNQQEPLASDDPRLHDATAPVAVTQLPMVGGALNGQAERALGTVLVEGALLSPRKLEVLRGIQRMLVSVDMDFKLGELALLFKFLSPDQLLAALLVSRGLVSPQQIAALGRIKQELGASGMDHDLETLLIMFQILPAEELRRLRSELS